MSDCSECQGKATHLCRKLAEAVAVIAPKRTTLHTLRHSYTAARLQTIDGGAPVSVHTVMRELGHSTLSLIEQTYGHLLDVRHRSPVVEYRETKVLEFPHTA